MNYKLYKNTTLVFETSDYDTMLNLFFTMGGSENGLKVTLVDKVNYLEEFEEEIL